MNWSALNAFWVWLSSVWSTVLPPAVIVFPADPAPDEQFGRFAWNNDKQVWDFS